jgi:hypothetical protein
MFAAQRCCRGPNQEACLVSQKILSISNDHALAGRADLREYPAAALRGSSGWSGASRRPPQGLPHTSPGAEPNNIVAISRGLPPSWRAVGLTPGRRDAPRPERARSNHRAVAGPWNVEKYLRNPEKYRERCP